MDKKQLKSSKSRKVLVGAALGVGAGLSGFGLRSRIRHYTLRRLALFPRVVGERTPRDLGMEYHEVWFQTRDGLKLHGWYIPDPPGGGATRHVTVIIGHGHTGNKEPDLHYAAMFYQAGYNVFMFDFRGHGRSEGPRGSSMGYWERLDVHAAVDWLLNQGQTRFAAFGISMGAAILIMAAAENPYIRAVIADSAYAHLYRSIAAELSNITRLPLWFTRPLGRYAWRIMADHHRFPLRSASPADYVAAIAPRPLLLIHGEEDLLTRPENAHVLYERAGEPKELWLMPGITHAQGYVSFGPTYQQRVLEFLDKVDWEVEPVLVAPTHTLDGLPVLNS